VLLVILDFDQFFTGNHSVEMIRDGRVVADENHHGRGSLLTWRSRLQLLKAFAPLPGEREQGVLGPSEYYFRLRFAAGQLFTRLQVSRDVLPKLEVFRVGPSGVINRWQSRDVCDAAFNRVHQAEVADNPRKR